MVTLDDKKDLIDNDLDELDDLATELAEIEDAVEEDLANEIDVDPDLELQFIIEPAMLKSSTGELGSYLNDVANHPRITPESEIELAKAITIGRQAQENLTAENAAELEPLIRTGHAAREAFINANYKLVIAIAKHYFAQATPAFNVLDIIQSGNLGLMKAIDRFDYTKGWKFSTYATWWIRQSIKRELLNVSHAVRIPVHIQESLAKIYLLEKRNGRSYTNEELAEALDISIAKVERLIRIKDTMNIISLDQEIETPGSNEATSLIEYVPSDLATPDMLQKLDERNTELHNILINRLNDRELYIVSRRFGLIDGKAVTLEVIGLELGITRERVRQIEEKALRKLKVPAIKDRLRELLNFE